MVQLESAWTGKKISNFQDRVMQHSQIEGPKERRKKE
jgi:hypothetical protein